MQPQFFRGTVVGNDDHDISSFIIGPCDHRSQGATAERDATMNTQQCGQCGETLKDVTLARFFFEDDSWLCEDCFAIEDSPQDSPRVDPVGETHRTLPPTPTMNG